MKPTAFRRRISLLLALCMTFSLALGCTGCGGTGGGFGASAASMFLRKTEGTVAVADAEGADVAPKENLGLYSGYTVGTEKASYAWIDLDKVKLAKIDANSEIAITKDGKSLTIDVTSGSMFFNVTEPLAEDETMEIRTSSMLVGIRGTCGWAAQNVVGLLEGTVTVTAGDESATITAGEQVWLTEDGALEVSALAYDAIPAFVAQELLDDEALSGAVLEASGLLIPTTYEELVGALAQKYPEYEIVYSEVIDFEADGSPELLVIYAGEQDGGLKMQIYRNGPEGIRWITGDSDTVDSTGREIRYSLAESNGRQFLCKRTEYLLQDSDITAYWLWYIGSLAERDGGFDDWGRVDAFWRCDWDSRFSGYPEYMMLASTHDERGFVDRTGQSEMEDARRYTLVKELYSLSFGS